jgi:hypothetical protein
MAGYRSNGRARRQVPGAQPTPNGPSHPGLTYTAVVWSCDRCGAAVTDQHGHNRFHAGLVALWNGRR